MVSIGTGPADPRAWIRAAYTLIEAAEDVAANIYRWEHGKVQLSDRYRLYYCHPGHPARPVRRPQLGPRPGRPPVIITISLPECTDTQLRLTSLDTPPGPGTGA
jgi:hypothetical protein